METKRIDFVDLAKGLCILLVVLFHLQVSFDYYFPYNHIMRCFRMPLYFILSGLFFKDYGGFKFFLAKKTNKLAIPYAFFYIINILLLPIIRFNLFPSHFEQPQINADYFLCFYTEKSNLLPNAIWFLLCLFILNLIFYSLFTTSKQIESLLIKKTNTKPNIFIISLILLSISIGVLGYFLGIKHINLPLFIDTALTVVPFFCFGYLLRKYTNLLQPNRYDKYNFIFIILSVFVIDLLYAPLHYNNNSYKISIYGLYITGMIGSLSVLFIAKYIKRMPVISYLGRYSIITLCTHEAIIGILKILFNYIHIDISSSIKILISLAIIVCLEVTIIVPFMIKFMPHVTAQKDILKLDSYSK